MKNEIKVRCKYYSKQYPKKSLPSNFWCTAPDNIDCGELFGRVTCSSTFKIDWIRFILLKEHVYEVKI